MKFFLYTAIFFILPLCVRGQETNELQDLYDTKSSQLKNLTVQLDSLTKQTEGLDKEVTTLKAKITPFPRWKFGLFGTGGFNVSTFSNWLSKETPNTNAVNIGLALNGFMEVEQKKYFFKNDFNNTSAWLKFDDKDNPDDETGFQVAADAFNFTSLFGWKIKPKVALSVLAEYRTSLLDGKFNNPGYLDLGGGGFTWTPTPDFKVVLHSLNFNWIFSDNKADFESSLGAKLIIDYTKQFNKNLAWKSNLSVFASYKDLDRLSNWTWVNNFSTAVKGIGIGLDIGLRSNKQEALAKELNDNPVQLYWILGLTYGLSKTW